MSWQKWNEEHKGQKSKPPGSHPMIQPEHLSQSGAPHATVQGGPASDRYHSKYLNKSRKLSKAAEDRFIQKRSSGESPSDAWQSAKRAHNASVMNASVKRFRAKYPEAAAENARD